MEESLYTAIGAADPVGIGLGWHYIAYRSPDNQTVVAECDDQKRIARFLSVPPEMKVLPLPEDLQVANGFPGQVSPMAFVLKDGRILAGTEEELVPQFRAVLREDPALLGVLTAPQIAEMCGDLSMLTTTTREAAAFMDGMPGNSGAMWRERELYDAFSAAFLEAFPKAAGDKYSGPVRDLHIHVEGDRFWVVLPAALWAVAGVDGVTSAVGQAIADGLGYTLAGFVDGGERPHRWRPATMDTK